MKNIPVLTLLLALILLLVAQVPDWSRALIYDRQAILQGEVWRLVGCVLIHYSATHLACNLLPLLLFGGWLETTSRARFVMLLLLAPLVNGVLILRPEVIYFAGSSGFVVAVVAGLCLFKSVATDRTWPWLLLLLLLVGKVGFEQFVSRAIFVPGAPPLLPLAHLLGLFSALLVEFLFSVQLRQGSPLFCSHWPATRR